MNKQIIIFSLLSWDSALLHRDQMLAREFARTGAKTYFVSRVTRKPWKIFSKATSEVIDGVNVISVYCLPYFRGRVPLIYSINNYLLARQLKTLDGQVNEERVLYVTNPDWDQVLVHFKGENSTVIYDISDDYPALAKNPGWRKLVEKHEQNVIKMAKQFVLTSLGLLGKVVGSRPYVVITNGVSLQGFAGAKPAISKDKYDHMVGFIGGIYEWVDLDLLKLTARAYPKVLFVLAGPSNRRTELAEFRKISNLRYLGVIPKAEVANYFASFDVGLVPFVSESVYPRLATVDSGKIYQYLYFGYPVVSTDYAQARELREVVTVAKTADEFLAKLGEALGEGKTEKRKKFAIQNSWENKAKEILQFIND